MRCPDVDLHGVVESFSPGTGAQFALLPPENATGNFTKIVQRVPVRIAIDAGAEARQRAGARPVGDGRGRHRAKGARATAIEGATRRPSDRRRRGGRGDRAVTSRCAERAER